MILVVFLSACATDAGIKSEMNEQAESVAAPSEEEQAAASGEDVDVQPQPPSFVLGPGDSIDIAVYRHDDLKRSVKVDLSGKTMFPLIGDVDIAGKDVFRLRDELTDRLSYYIKDPQVLINITATSSQKVVVLGEVKTPGVLTLDTDMTIMEVVARAGGLSSDAKGSEAALIRRVGGASKVTKIDLSSAILEGDSVSRDMVARPGDIIYVPRSKIADVAWLFSQITSILAPIVTLEGGIVLAPQVSDALHGTGGSSTLSIPTR